MIPAPLVFLLDWAGRATLLMAAALVAVWAMRGSSSELRNFVLRCGLACSVLLPLGMWASAHYSSPLLPPALPSISAPLSSAVSASPSVGVEPGGAAVRADAPVAKPFDFGLLFELVYLAGALVCLARWGISYVRIFLLSQSGYTHSAEGDYLVCRDGPLSVPVTFGFFRPLILLPAEAVEWPQDRIRAVLLHEHAHILRRDWLWLSTAALFNAIQWFNPFAWMLTSSLRSSAEESADDFVLQSGVSASMYAKHLLYFASNARTHLASSISITRTGNLTFRLKRILDANHRVTALRPAKALALGAAFAASGLVLANYGAAAPSLMFDQGVAHWSDGAEASIQFIGDGQSETGAGWLADGTPAKASDVPGVSNSISSSVSDPSKKTVAIYYSLKGNPSLGHVRVRLLGSTPMGSSSGGGSGGGFSGGVSSGGRSHSASGGTSSSASSGGPSHAGAGSSGSGNAGGGAGGGAGGNPGSVSGDTGSGSGADDGREVDHSMQSFTVPANMPSTSFMLGKGTGPYRVSQELTGSALKVTAQTQHISGSQSVNGVDTDTSHDVTSSVLNFPLADNIADKDWRIVAYGADGKELPVTNPGFGPVSIRSGQKTYRAEVNAAPTEISRVVLEARDFEWITIKNVPLAAKHS